MIKNNQCKQLYFTATFLPAVMLLYTFIVWPGLSGPFIFDDFPNLQNLAILNNGLTWETLGHYLASFTNSPGRPISALSFLINDYAWPSNPHSFKYTNILIHMLNGVLVFGLVKQLTKSCAALPQNKIWPALAMAAWLLHPIQLSAQMLVVQRMTLLSASFSFAGLWAYCALIQNAKTQFGVFKAMAALGLATTLAFLCKENGAMLPLMACVLNFTLMRTTIAELPRNLKYFVTASCTLPALLSIVGIFFTAFQTNAFSSRQFNMIERLMTQLHVVADYLKGIFLPRLAGSGIYHDDFVITRNFFDSLITPTLLIILIFAIVYAIKLRASKPLFSFAVLWFVAGHVLESSIVPLELYFEHRNYLPLLGIAMAISAIPFGVEVRKKLAFSLLSVWLIILAALTLAQAQIWGNTALMTTMWTIDKPLSLRATQERARFLYDNGQVQEANNTLMDGYGRGIHFIDLPLNAILLTCNNPRISNAANIKKTVATMAESAPYSNSVLITLKRVRESIQNNKCPNFINQKSWLLLTEALLRNPQYKLVAEDKIRIERAQLHMFNRDLNGTVSELELAYARSPNVALSQKIAGVLLSAGLLDEAEKWLKDGLKLKQPFFDTLMHDPKDRSRQLLDMIKKVKANKNTLVDATQK